MHKYVVGARRTEAFIGLDGQEGQDGLVHQLLTDLLTFLLSFTYSLSLPLPVCVVLL